MNARSCLHLEYIESFKSEVTTEQISRGSMEYRFDPNLPGERVPFVGDLPPSIEKLGFSFDGQLPKRMRTFTLRTGPQGTPKRDDELGVLLMYLEDGFLDVMTKEVQKWNSIFSCNMTKDHLIGRIAFTLGSGIASYPEERFVFRKHTTRGLIRNDFLSSLLTYEELSSAKKVFRATRDEMTEVFNITSKKFWIPGQFIAMDEGAWGTYLNSAEKSYIPGKPHPNCFEYFGACDEYFYLQNLYWEKRGYIDEKYTRPETMAGLVRTYVDYFTDTYSRNSVVQPFVFYFDSRFSSFESFKYLADSDYRTVMSLSSGAKPKFLFQYLRFGAITNEDEAEEPEYAQTSKKKKQPKISKDAVELEKREWRELYLENGYLVGLRPKKKAFLYLLANHSTCLPIRMNNIRNKWPRRSYFVNTPEVQKDYNMHKMQVDAWNRLVMNYAQEVKVNNEREIYFNFFVNAYTTQSYIWWKYSHRAAS